ncbi:DUF1636 family protein [Amycolatopsis panacis]|uniref:DUF1636 domain-containing protein n=1 Tax=Amycolatopsis panacis TaxID=2340917 RepID=A0A419HJF1_9PSEU|nr:DUF1636 family protein [Amycolatopsis panacis]RJQ75936.1 DUF1636 domain-containing protein [Amycolatopsis panacis]
MPGTGRGVRPPGPIVRIRCWPGRIARGGNPLPLLICRTCPRYDTRRAGQFCRDLQHHLNEEADRAGIDLRSVQCLGGCPVDGVAAVDEPGKARVRFSGLRPEHAAALVEAVRAYAESDSGEPDDWEVPDPLASRISSVTLKRLPRSAA